MSAIRRTKLRIIVNKDIQVTVISVSKDGVVRLGIEKQPSNTDTEEDNKPTDKTDE